MAIALRKQGNEPASTHRRSPIGPPKPRPGQHYSLSPVAQKRLRTLPLPFDVIIASDVVAPNVAASQVATQPALTASPATDFTSLDDVAPATSLNKSSVAPSQAQRALVAQLSREVKRIEVAGRVQPDQLGRRSAVFSSGSSTIDGCLPYGGYESGTIIEYLQNSAGSGATTLALTAAREALSVTDRFCVIVDWRQQFYPPAAAALGIDLKRMVIVRPLTLADRLWAIDQALRSPSIVAVVAEVEQLDDHAARRLQLAAESGGSLGLLVRNSLRQQPSWAEVQWLVQPMRTIVNSNSTTPNRQLQLELLRVRGGQSGSRLHLQVNAASGRIEPAATSALARALARTAHTIEGKKARRA